MVSPRDPTLLLPDGMDYTTLIQIQLSNGTNYDDFNRDLSTFWCLANTKWKYQVKQEICQN
jgi:hypothetical protein